MLQSVVALLLLFTTQMCSTQAAELFTFMGSSTKKDTTTLPPEFIADTAWTVIPNCDAVSDQTSTLAIRVSSTQQFCALKNVQCSFVSHCKHSCAPGSATVHCFQVDTMHLIGSLLHSSISKTLMCGVLHVSQVSDTTTITATKSYYDTIEDRKIWLGAVDGRSTSSVKVCSMLTHSKHCYCEASACKAACIAVVKSTHVCKHATACADCLQVVCSSSKSPSAIEAFLLEIQLPTNTNTDTAR
jgi:hypothetical protein